MLDDDCLERIMKFADDETVANMTLVSKGMNQLSSRINKFNKFHYDYEKAFREFRNNKNNITRKKRLIYKILDLVTDNQEHWRIVRGIRSQCLSREIHTFIGMFIFLTCIPKSKKNKYSKKLKTFYDLHAHKYKRKIYV